MAEFDPAMLDDVISRFKASNAPARKPDVSTLDKVASKSAFQRAVARQAPPPEAAPDDDQPDAAPAPQAGPWSQLSQDDESRFQSDVKAHPWFTEFKKKYGEAPNLNDPDYNYRAAWKAGLMPEIYPHDGTYHWQSSLPDGTMLKSENHPTAWMEHFMRVTGKDPNDVGVSSPEQAMAYVSSRGAPAEQAERPPAQLKNPRQGLAEALQDLDFNATDKINAARAESDVIGQGEAERREVLGRQREDMDQSAERGAVRRAGYRANRSQDMTAWKKLNDESANTEIVDRRTRGMKVQGALSMFLSGIADSFNRQGGHDTHLMADVQNHLNEWAARDVETQRANLENKRHSAANKLSELGIARDFFGDDEQAESFAEAQRKDAYANDLMRAASRMTEGQAKAGLLKVAADTKEQVTATKAGIYQNLELQRQRTASARYGAMARGADVKPGEYSRADLEAMEKDRSISADQQLKLDQIRANERKANDEKVPATLQKTRSLLAGVAPAAKNLRSYESKAAPTVGVAPGTQWIPDAVLPKENAEYQRDSDAVADILLRDESGAAISPDEQKKKRHGWGLDSSDPAIRQHGLKSMLYEYDARMQGKGRYENGIFIPEPRGKNKGAPAPAAAPANDDRPIWTPPK